jgi:hypothetical protein
VENPPEQVPAASAGVGKKVTNSVITTSVITTTAAAGRRASANLRSAAINLFIPCLPRWASTASDLPWVPEQSYRTNKILAHRLGVNAFFCALAETSRTHDGHCLATWRPEHWVRTKTVDVKPDGFGRYLHPGGACEFYLEYDRGTEAFGALSRKLEGYLRLAMGWTKEQDLTGFPNLLIIVPEGVREGEVGSALRHGIRGMHIPGSLATSFPLFVASEDRLSELGVLGPGWKHLPTDGDRLSLLDLPAQPPDLYRTARCLGRYFTDADPGHRRRISPASATPRFRALPPRHAP